MADFTEGVGCLSVFCEMLHKQHPVSPIKTVVNCHETACVSNPGF